MFPNQEDLAPSHSALATVAPGAPSSSSSPPSSSSSATESPRRSSTRRGRLRRRRRRRRARRRPNIFYIQGLAPSQVISMSPFQTIQSRRCRISQSSSCWCRCSSWSSTRCSSSWCSSTASTHLRSCTNAATHPEDAVKLFSILFHDWVVGYSSSVLKLYQYQDMSPRSTKVVSMANVGKSKAGDPVIKLNCVPTTSY